MSGTAGAPLGPRHGSVGVLLPGTQARIVDPASGQDLGTGEPGELWVRGPQVMRGYLNAELANTEQPMTMARMTGAEFLRRCANSPTRILVPPGLQPSHGRRSLAARRIAAPHIATIHPAQDLVLSRERWCNAWQLRLRRYGRAGRAPSAHCPISVRPGVAQRRSRPVELTQTVQSGPADPGDSAAQRPAHQLAALARIQPVRGIEQAMQQRITMTRRHPIGTREQLLKPRRIAPQRPGSGPPAQRRLNPALVTRHRLITDLHRPRRAISGAELQPLPGYPGEREHGNDLVAEQRLGPARQDPGRSARRTPRPRRSAWR